MHIPDRAVAQHEPLSAKPPSWPAQVGKAVPFWGCHWEGLSFTWLGAEGWDLLTVGGFPCWRSKFKAAKLWHDFKHLLFDMSHGILMAQPAPVGVGHPSREAKRRQAGAGALPTAQPSSRGCADPQPQELRGCCSGEGDQAASLHPQRRSSSPGSPATAAVCTGKALADVALGQVAGRPGRRSRSLAPDPAAGGPGGGRVGAEGIACQPRLCPGGLPRHLWPL